MLCQRGSRYKLIQELGLSNHIYYALYEYTDIDIYMYCLMDFGTDTLRIMYLDPLGRYAAKRPQ